MAQEVYIQRLTTLVEALRHVNRMRPFTNSIYMEAQTEQTLKWAAEYQGVWPPPDALAPEEGVDHEPHVHEQPRRSEGEGNSSCVLA